MLRNAVASDIEHFKSIRERPTRQVFTGEMIKQQPKQRRKIEKHTPKILTGRRRKDDERYLVSAIASAYSRFTGQEVTQNWEGHPAGSSPFEQFLYPILKDLKIFDAREKLSDHLTRRRTPFAPLYAK